MSNLCIVDFENVQDAVNFAKETWPDSDMFQTMLNTNKGNEPWIGVASECDICKFKCIFFAPAAIYDDEIKGAECSECGCMTLYPEELNDG